MRIAAVLPLKQLTKRWSKLIILCFVIVAGWIFIFHVTSRNRSSKPGSRSRPKLADSSFQKTGPFGEIQINNGTKRHIAMPGSSPVPSKHVASGSCPDIHIFYYPWFGNPQTDGSYLHWNHAPLALWWKKPHVYSALPRHKPPDDIASDFYPSLGAYSSRDTAVISDHMAQIRSAGAGVVVVSYYPIGHADQEGKDWSGMIPILFDEAGKLGLKVTFQIEPYQGRNEKTVRNDIEWIVKTYGKHNALYRKTHRSDLHGSILPFVYVYDSYHTPALDWASIFDPNSEQTIRGTALDCIAVALLVEAKHRDYVTVGHFDGLYTYFATNGFTYGSTWDNWSQLSRFADDTETFFIPCVGPGYVDISIRPWNTANSRSRDNGGYYNQAWQKAISSLPSLIAITSFNEWHEGTQIEKAVPRDYSSRKYIDYLPNHPDYYLVLSRNNGKTFPKCSYRL